jgi:hypothetical protein
MGDTHGYSEYEEGMGPFGPGGMEMEPLVY